MCTQMFSPSVDIKYIRDRNYNFLLKYGGVEGYKVSLNIAIIGQLKIEPTSEKNTLDESHSYTSSLYVISKQTGEALIGAISLQSKRKLKI